MHVKSNILSLDVSTLQWGRGPVPLLPSALVERWANERIPDWAAEEAGLPAGSTLSALNASVCNAAKSISVNERIAYYAQFVVRSRIAGIRGIRCFKTIWPVGFSIETVPFSVRSRNVLLQNRYLKQPERLMEATCGELLLLPNLGTRSLIEIVTLVEAAIDLYAKLTTLIEGPAQAPAAEVREANTASMYGTDWHRSLAAILDESWVHQISAEDKRFAQILPPGEGSLEERIEQLLSDPNSLASATDLPALLSGTEKIKEIIRASTSLPLEKCLEQLLVAYLGNRTGAIKALTLRFGWDGNDPRTLQEAGDEINVTRERVRQIEEKFLKRLPKQPIFLPPLDRAMTLLEKNAPISLKSAASLLQSSGIAQGHFSAISLLHTAEMLRRANTLKVHDIKGKRLIVSSQKLEGIGDITAIARRLAGANGVTSVYQVAEKIAEGKSLEKKNTNEEDVRQLLRSLPEYEFLDEDWLWMRSIPEGRNRLENVAKKVLSVVSPQPMQSIREAVRRSYKWRASTSVRYRSLVVPPLTIMKCFFERHPDFVVQGDEKVGLVKALDYRAVLGEAEQVIVEVLRSSPAGLLDRNSLLDACIKRGLNENTLSLYVTYSPIVEHIGIDLWKLRGVMVDPAAVEAIRRQNELAPKERRVLDYGWSEAGELWIAWRLPRITGSNVVGIPGAVRRYIVGRSFAAVAKDSGRECGTIAVNADGMSYGYAPFLRYSGADEGDVLIAEFSLSAEVASLSLSDEVPS